MEEVDNIIIHTLKQIGCDIDDNITNMGGFSTELVVEATVRCLEIIRPGLELSRSFPENMAAKFRMASNLAQICSELGYRGDIGIQTFLYSSEADLRRVFMFLLEKLPKESDKEVHETLSKLEELERSIAGILAVQLSKPWLPHYCHKSSSGGYTKMPYTSVKLEETLIDTKDETLNEYQTRYQPSICDQLTNPETLLPSIISHQARLLHSKPLDLSERIKFLNDFKKSEDNNKQTISFNETRLMSRFLLNERLESTPEPSKSEEKNTNEEEVSKLSSDISKLAVETSEENKEEMENVKIEQMKTDCENLRSQIEVLQSEIKQLSVELTEKMAQQQEEQKKMQELETERNIDAKIYELMKDPDNSVEKLEEAVEAEKNKLINLATQWEKHRVPLIKQYRDEREKYFAKTSTSQKKLDELRQLREKEKELLEECQQKDQQYYQLMSEVAKLPKDVNRSAYTQRILEIINNVRKQKDEINKVLGDTREIQKEINVLTGKLERSFTVVDEMIFRDAKNNEASRKAYKLLATLHSDCSELVKLVEETGATMREIRDLEEQIDAESAKNIEANLERITADLEQMRQETASLTAQLANKKL
ncbi:coiled-coil domain-containing protein 22 homolog [Chelonus insularis]|uniref:coiled-coil domain-containing protein 22 homolog n=1 Tax=Chelonus insularis TaxID=460826 RepID=UPI00158DBFDF|nr:coiled-coil domain-containing protein 22 homolog [Chelonus insularis]